MTRPFKCRALLLRCIDYRLEKPGHAYLERRGLGDACDILSVAGSVRTLVRSSGAEGRDFLLGQIALSMRLHSPEEIVLMNHTDCGAYGGTAAFPSEEAETRAHLRDLAAARGLIRSLHPGVAVRLLLARVARSGQVRVREVRPTESI
jgi:carbonic anhydrase